MWGKGGKRSGKMGRGILKERIYCNEEFITSERKQCVYKGKGSTSLQKGKYLMASGDIGRSGAVSVRGTVYVSSRNITIPETHLKGYCSLKE